MLKRCEIHLIIAESGSSEQSLIGREVRWIWLRPNRTSAKKLVALIVEEYKKEQPEARRFLEDGTDDRFQFYKFSMIKREEYPPA